jgi:quinoprotein glucose dehydrogenase
MVHHDLWDFDASAAPQLITVMHNGQKVDAVAQATKQGFLFAFNRVTGEPLWPVEERPVPKSTMPGEESWPTQPVPTVIPPFSRQVVTADDINPYFTAEQKEMWKKRIAAAHSGLFEPLSDQYETITMPGANGGAIHGNTAANPVKGYVYVSYQDKPSVYRLKKVEPDELRIPLSADETERAKTIYIQNCQGCHGVNHEGAVGPSLIDINNRVTFDNFKIVVGTGRGQMPSFLHLGDQNVTAVYKFLSSAQSQRGGARGRGGFQSVDVTKIDGPVVATGGAPGGEEFQKMPVKPMRDYPEGVTPPKVKYTDGSTTSYGLGYPNLLAPPWSAIAAYDLNTGKLKWKRALGNDDRLGGKDTGLPVGSQHKGMIVTATGIVFATCLDGRIYAYDEDNGNLLWSVKLPRVPDGLPTMYQVNGRQYLAICSVSDPINKSDINAPRQYIVFALPQKK